MNDPVTTLLSLPWDIRLQILEHLLHSPTPLSRITKVVAISRFNAGNGYRKQDITHWRFEAGGRLHLHPSILSVCRQLYNEAYSILYGNTILISVALFESFEPVDVLGHWRFDELLSPTVQAGFRLPDLRRFVNMEFNIYVDFTRDRAKDPENAFNTICRELRDSGVQSLNCVTVSASDGSSTERYGENVALWTSTLSGLAELRCRFLKVSSNVPNDVKTWLQEKMLVL